MQQRHDSSSALPDDAWTPARSAVPIGGRSYFWNEMSATAMSPLPPSATTDTLAAFTRSTPENADSGTGTAMTRACGTGPPNPPVGPVNTGVLSAGPASGTVLVAPAASVIRSPRAGGVAVNAQASFVIRTVTCW